MRFDWRYRAVDGEQSCRDDDVNLEVFVYVNIYVCHILSVVQTKVGRYYVLVVPSVSKML